MNPAGPIIAGFSRRECPHNYWRYIIFRKVPAHKTLSNPHNFGSLRLKGRGEPFLRSSEANSDCAFHAMTRGVTMERPEKKLTVLDQITASDKVRKKIIDTASVLYAKKGFRATSIQEISEEAGVSLPVTYHYVKQKSEIMRLIMEDLLHNFQKGLIKEIEGIDNPLERLRIAVHLYHRVVDRERKKVLLVYQKSSSLDKVSRSKVMQLEVDGADILAQIIQDGIEQGVFKEVDVDLVAYDIMMMAHMWVLKGWHFKDRLTLEEYIDLQMASIMDILKK